MTARNIGVAERLRQIREALGLNQPDMATKNAVHFRTYQDYEAGKRLPGAETLLVLANEGIDINWLLTGAGQMLRYPDGAAPPAGVTKDGGLSARMHKIHADLVDGRRQPDAEIERELREISADANASSVDRATANMLLNVVFKDRDAERRQDLRMKDVGAQIRGATHLLDTALKAISWTPSKLIWHTLQSIVFSYGIELDDLISLTSAMKYEIESGKGDTPPTP